MRASRLLSILILLQLRQRLTAEALADEFEVSVRTIYRDIDALSAAGVPVYGDRGPGGGFQLLEGYRTKLTGLARDEAEAMLMISLPDQADALGLGRSAARARDKLLAALPGEGQVGATRVAERFHLDTQHWYRAARPAPCLAALARAVLDQQPVAMRYQSWRGARDWRVEPLGLVLKAGDWYLVAETARGVLTFTVADIATLQVLAGNFERPKAFDLSAWWADAQAAFEARLRPDQAVLRVSPAGLPRLRRLGSFAAQAVASAAPPDAQGWRCVTLPLEPGEEGALPLLALGAEFEVIAPASLRAQLEQSARALCESLRVPLSPEA